MFFAIQVLGLMVALPLELLLIARLKHDEYRRFPFVFLYAVIYFLTTIAEIPSMVAMYSGAKEAENLLAFVYWLDEVIMQVLVYLVVLSLIYKATAGLRSRRLVRASLLAGAVVFTAVSYFLHYSPGTKPGLWMTPFTRDLNFCSAILDLALWALLIGSRLKDHRLLMLSGGLGIQFTGEAIGEAFRSLAIQNRSRPLSAVGSLLMMLTSLISLYIWCQAFRTQTVGKRHAALAPDHSK
jgi:hypothetical protein